MEQTTQKRNYKTSLLLLLFCLLSFTVFQYIPIYFVDNGLRTLYYFILLVLLVIITTKTVFKLIYNPKKNNKSSARLSSVLIGFITFIVFGFWTLGLFFSLWTETTTFYIKKDNPKIKIVRGYINEGAFGGGTESEDYNIVLYRPFLFLFKIETSIDTNSIKKSEWKKPDLYNQSKTREYQSVLQ